MEFDAEAFFNRLKKKGGDKAPIGAVMGAVRGDLAASYQRDYSEPKGPDINNSPLMQAINEYYPAPRRFRNPNADPAADPMGFFADGKKPDPNGTLIPDWRESKQIARDEDPVDQGEETGEWRTVPQSSRSWFGQDDPIANALRKLLRGSGDPAPKRPTPPPA